MPQRATSSQPPTGVTIRVMDGVSAFPLRVHSRTGDDLGIAHIPAHVEVGDVLELGYGPILLLRVVDLVETRTHSACRSSCLGAPPSPRLLLCRRTMASYLRNPHKGEGTTCGERSLLCCCPWGSWPCLPQVVDGNNVPTTCFGQLATIVGTNHDDVLAGTTGSDVAVLLDGDKFFDGLGGNDRVCGGDGDDFLVGGAGGDLMAGGTGADQLRGDFFLDRQRNSETAATTRSSAATAITTELPATTSRPTARPRGTAETTPFPSARAQPATTWPPGRLRGMVGETIQGCRGCVGDNQSFASSTSGTGGADTITGSTNADLVIGDNEASGGRRRERWRKRRHLHPERSRLDRRRLRLRSL